MNRLGDLLQMRDMLFPIDDHAGRGAGGADGSDGIAGDIQDRYCIAGQTDFKFLVIAGVTIGTDLLQYRQKLLGTADGGFCMGRKIHKADILIDGLLRFKGEDSLACTGQVGILAEAQRGIHFQRGCPNGLIQKNDMGGSIDHAKMGGLPSLCRQLLQIRMDDGDQLHTVIDQLPQGKELQSQPIFIVFFFQKKPTAFQCDQHTKNGAFIDAGKDGDLVGG